MAQILVILGAAIFGILGTLHLLYTFYTSKFDPFDPAAKLAMESTSPQLTKDTTMWKAWIGFNASHSLGAILVAAFYIPLSLINFSIIEQSLWFIWLPVAIGLVYLWLANRYWFKIPFIGILLATVCFMIAALHMTSEMLLKT